MPTISLFYGIAIMMYPFNKEHNPPHIHAFCGSDDASFIIADGTILAGYFPSNKKKLVQQFIKQYKEELLNMWNTGSYYKLPPIS